MSFSTLLSFYLSIALITFLPGYFLLCATGLKNKFTSLEIFVLSLVSGIAVSDFLIILLGKFGWINKIGILAIITIFCLICLYFFSKSKNKETGIKSDFSTRTTILIILLMFLTIFIKTFYFKDAIFPTATDLGHHMFWTKTIATTGQLPQYKKVDISSDLTIGKPQPIADFIIGEHLIFAAVGLLSGADYVGAFPALLLLFINIMTALSVFIAVRELFKKSPHRDTIALFALFLVGPLYALASPQAKFASGGVIGNTIGNLFIPSLVLIYVRAFSENSSKFLAYALFLSLGLAYTHHLSTFVFIFLSFFTVIAYAILNRKTVWKDAKGWLGLAKSPAVLAVLAMSAIFVFFIYTPSYLNTRAINTAVGAPSKASRAGLTLTQLKTTAGEARFAFAIAGIILILLAKNLGKYRQSFLIGWLTALTLMSLRPDWMLVDIPSDRIASYIVFPAAIIAAYMFTSIFAMFKAESNKSYLNPTFALIVFFAFTAFVAANGFNDDAVALNTNSSAGRAILTYNAASYLASKSNPQDIILKDHNYLAGDSWIKLFFMQDYNYPLSRGYFKRYEDTTKNREQCTNLMISQPNGEQAKLCYNGTKTDFIMINPANDAAQFHRLNDFWQVYTSDEVGIFYKSK